MGQERRDLSKIIFVLITLISVSGFLFCASLVRNRGAIFKESDPLGYYLYARSIVHDGDIDFSNELSFFKKPGTQLVGGIGLFNPKTQRYTNQYTIGFPLLVLPFYGTFSAVASLVSRKIRLVFRSNDFLFGQHPVGDFGYLAIVQICFLLFFFRNQSFSHCNFLGELTSDFLFHCRTVFIPPCFYFRGERIFVFMEN